MIANMNEKGRQTKLLAAIAVLAMVVCVFTGLSAISNDTSGYAEEAVVEGAVTVSSVEDLSQAFTDDSVSKIVLGADIEITSKVALTVDRPLVLDLNGNTLTMSYDEENNYIMKIVDGGVLTIEDSKTDGAIKSTSASHGYGIQLRTGSTLIVNSGTIETTQESIDIYTISENVRIEINGGHIKSTSDSVMGVRGDSNIDVDINGGTLESAGRTGIYISTYSDTPIQFDMNGGELIFTEGGSGAIQAYKGAQITIGGDAKITSTSYIIQVQENVVTTINGGTLTSTGTYDFSVSEEATLNIDGGTFDDEFNVRAEESSKVNINSDVDFYNLYVEDTSTVTVGESAAVTIANEIECEAGGSIINDGVIELLTDAQMSMDNLNQMSGTGSMIAGANQISITGTTQGEPTADDFGVIAVSKNIYDGTAQEPNIRVVGPSNVSDVSIYEDTIVAETDAGTYSATITISFTYTLENPGSSYTGRITFDFQWTIFAYEIGEADVADIPVQGITDETTGPFEPALNVVCDGTVLIEGVDYTVTYENNDVAGTGKAIVTGINNYAGTVEKEFYIIDYQGYIDDLEEFIGGNEGLGKVVPGAEPMTYAQVPAIYDAINSAYSAIYNVTDPSTIDQVLEDAKMDIVIATKDTVKHYLATVYNNGQGYMGKVMTKEQYDAALTAIGPAGAYLPKDIINVYENALDARTDFDHSTYISQLEEFIGGSEGLGKTVPGAEPMTYAQVSAIYDAINATYAAIYASGDAESAQNALEDGEMDIVIATKDTVKHYLATVYNNGQGYMGWMMTEEQYNAALESVGPSVYLPKDIVNAYENALDARTACYSITYMVGDELYLYQGGAINDFKAIVGCTVVPEGMTFVAWNVAGTDIFYMPGDMIELGVDTNMWGESRTIVLNAVYSGESETPDEPSEPTAPSADVVVSMYYQQGNRLVISLTAVDGGHIPAGTLTITGNYVIMEEVIPGLVLPSTYSFEQVIDIDEGQTTIVLSADDYNFVSGIIGIDASYAGADIAAESNHMTFTFVAPSTEV